MDYNYDAWNDDNFIPYELMEPGFQPLDSEYDNMFGFNEPNSDNNSFFNCNNNPAPVGDPAIVPGMPMQNYEAPNVVEESPAVPTFVPVPNQMATTGAPECFGGEYENYGREKVEWPLYSSYQIECPPPPPPIPIDEPSEAVPFNNLAFKRKLCDFNDESSYYPNDSFVLERDLSACTNEYNVSENNDAKKEDTTDEASEKYKDQVNTRQVQFENYCNKKSICMSNVAKFSKPRSYKSEKGEDFDLEEEEEEGTPKKKRTQTVAQIFERRKQTLWKMSDSIDMITGGK